MILLVKYFSRCPTSPATSLLSCPAPPAQNELSNSFIYIDILISSVNSISIWVFAVVYKCYFYYISV